MAWMWIAYALIVLLISGAIGLHLGRFREAYSEMTGMMAGMTMGMLNGFLLGYASAAALATGASMFWGNLFGILLGIAMGVYFGRAGGLMGILDGAMGGVMGGSMGAMLAVMVAFPRDAIYWTALLLGVIYIAGMAGLVALIEQSSPQHAAMHRVLPMFSRAVATEAAEERAFQEETVSLRIADYYAFLGIPRSATHDQIGVAYLAKLAMAKDADIEHVERALAILTNPHKRQVYDQRLGKSRAANDHDERGGRQSPRSGTDRSRPSAAKHVPARKPTASAKSSVARVQHDAPAPARRESVAQRNEAPISWVGALAAGVLVVMLVAWWFVSQGGSRIGAGSNTTIDPQLEAQAVIAPIGPDGRQTLDFIVNGYTSSYEPKAIKVKKDVPVHLNVSLKGPDPG